MYTSQANPNKGSSAAVRESTHGISVTGVIRAQALADSRLPAGWLPHARMRHSLRALQHGRVQSAMFKVVRLFDLVVLQAPPTVLSLPLS